MTCRAVPATLEVMTTKSLLLTEFGGSASADVDARADEVFALLTDISRLPRWNTRIRRVLESARRPLAPGVEWVVQMQVSGARWPSRSTAVTYDPGQLVFEYTTRSDDGNPTSALWRWKVTPIPGQRSRIEVSWHVAPRTFWRRALFGKLRRRQMGDEVTASLRALGALAQDSVTAS
jgi:uncharacterized protein YndB with AHSA1/START domain